MPTLSIITVNYNNNKGLIASIESIKQQSFTDYEHIIIDAGSTDGSLETIKQYTEESSHLSFWCSEPDKGVYDGMNKGIEHASGVYFNFLNSGDCLKKDILRHIDFDGTKYIYGDVSILFPNNRVDNITSPYPVDPIFIILKDTICHQACFIHKSLFNNKRYDITYKLASDWIHIVENIIFKECSYKHVPFSVVDYDGCGMSATSGSLGVEERMRWIKQNIPSTFYNSLIELDLYKSSELANLIPRMQHDHKFQKRARKIVRTLWKIHCIFHKK